MKALVTGGSGFLGSHVADALSEAGHEVTVLDVKPSPYLRDSQGMAVGDIMDRDFIDDAIGKSDVVYHFAGIADIDECMHRPLDTVKYNILGTAQILESCRAHEIKRFVFASSVYVYSRSGFFYRTSKQSCESLIEDYHHLYGLRYTILRYGSLYGERSDERNSIYGLIKQALSEGKITYRGTGNELREYIHVRDAALSSARILDPEFENQYVILTGNQSLKYRDLLDMIREILGNDIEIDIKPSKRKAHYRITPYNFSPKLGRKLTCNPHIDMGQGLLSCMAEIYRELHEEKSEAMGLFVDRDGGGKKSP